MIHDNLPLDKAMLIGIFLESLLFGISTLLFLITIWVLVYHRKSERLNKRLVATSSLMMLLGTIHLSIDFTRILQGFIDEREIIGGPVAFFTRLFEWKFVFKTAIFIFHVTLADSFATYRCYVVWSRCWAAAVLPSIFVSGTLVAGIGVCYLCSNLKAGTSIFASVFTGWVTAFFTFTLVANLCCTSLIASRIWFTTKKVARFSGQQTLLPVVIIVVESGAIYSLTCVIILILYLAGSNAQYPMIDATFPIISIVFNLIIVRITLGIAHSGSVASGTTHSTPSGVVDPGAAVRSNPVYQYPMKPLAVTVTQLVQQDADADADTDMDPEVYSKGLSASTSEDSEAKEAKERGAWNAV